MLKNLSFTVVSVTYFKRWFTLIITILCVVFSRVTYNQIKYGILEY